MPIDFHRPPGQFLHRRTRREGRGAGAAGYRIKGNTHMLMQNDNSLDITDILLDWIGKHVTTMQ
jgi:hypothetical protein